MTVYLDLLMLLNFGVDLLLLIASGHLAGYRIDWRRYIVAAAFGAVYAGACVLPGLIFLQDVIWRLISLILMSVISFGWRFSTVRRGVLFSFLSFALGGAAMGINRNDFISLLLCSGVIVFLCLFGFGGRVENREYLPVELQLNNKKIRIIALLDTGNTLKDPLTGEQVLVVGSDIAWDMLGLTQQQLADPIATMTWLPFPGLRLIPYSSVGRPSGMLLGVSMDSVTVAGKPAGKVVAFAPDVFRNSEGYQGLSGGIREC